MKLDGPGNGSGRYWVCVCVLSVLSLLFYRIHSNFVLVRTEEFYVVVSSFVWTWWFNFLFIPSLCIVLFSSSLHFFSVLSDTPGCDPLCSCRSSLSWVQSLTCGRSPNVTPSLLTFYHCPFDSHPHPNPLTLYSHQTWSMIWLHVILSFNSNISSVLNNSGIVYWQNSYFFKKICASVWRGEDRVMMMFQQEIKWDQTASVSSSLLRYQLQQPNHDVIMSTIRKGHFSFSALRLIVWDNHLSRTCARK